MPINDNDPMTRLQQCIPVVIAQHKVEAGENLYKIARDQLVAERTACSDTYVQPTDADIRAKMLDLQKINGISNPNKIWTGQTIRFFRPPSS